MPDDPQPRAPFRRCASCGATLEADAAALSTLCAYCGSTLVDCVRGRIEVDRVAPFRIPRQAALQRLREHLAGRWWAPRDLRALARSGHLRPHALRGVLVPFFAYTATVQARYRARIGLHWYRTETRRRKGKDELRTVQEIEWFDLRGTAADQLEDHLVAASVGLDLDESRRLEPFDLGAALRFDPLLMAGWIAELPSRPRNEADQSARQSIYEHERRLVHRNLLPGDRRKLQHFDCDIDLRRVELVLLPVWIAGYRFRGQNMRLLVNGQTGACIGRVPLSVGKIVVVAGLALVAVMLSLWLFMRIGSNSWT